MVSSDGTSEIVEANEDLNLVYNSVRSNSLNFKLKTDQRDGKTHVHPVDDDLDQLIKSLHLRRASSRISGPSHQMGAEVSRQSAMKKPVRVAVPQTSRIGISESITLKQSLRRLCISQASEMAVMKRLSKQIGMSGSSEAGTIQRLYASVVVQAGNSDLNDGKGNLVKISLLPEKSVVNSSEQVTEISPASDVNSSHQTAVSSPHGATPMTANLRKLATKNANMHSSNKRRDRNLAAMDIGMKGTVNSKTSMSAFSFSIQTRKPSIHLRQAKLRFTNKACPKGQGRQDPASTNGASNRSQDWNRDDAVLCCSNLPCEKECTCSASYSNSNGMFGIINKDNGACKSDCSPNSSKGVTPADMKISGNIKSRAKGDSSQSSKSSLGDYSSSTSISEETNMSGSVGNISRPHTSRDLRWIAIQHVMMQHKNLSLKKFKILKRLGCGDIGTVYLAELVGSKCLFALKVMDNEFLLSRKKMPRAQTEKEILQMVDHPFLPTLYAHFSTDNLSCLVMEYCPAGDLHVLRQRQPGGIFPEAEARFYVAEVLLAMEYLHMLGVVYRDLKPENILVREDGHIMLSDFDLSLRCTVNPTLVRSSSSLETDKPVKTPQGPWSESSCTDAHCLQPSCAQVSCFPPRKPKPDSTLPQLVVEPTDAHSNSFVGTHEYLAPEILRGDGHGSPVDWWTLGVFLYELLYGRTPFKGTRNDDTLANVISQSLVFPESPVVSVQGRDLIAGLLMKEPEHRLGSVTGAADIKQHPFFDGLNWALIRSASPPEIPPRNHSSGDQIAVRNRKEGKCVDSRSTSEDVAFELF